MWDLGLEIVLVGCAEGAAAPVFQLDARETLEVMCQLWREVKRVVCE